MIERLATAAMGTRFELVLAGGDPVRARAAGEAALETVEECDARLSAFRRDSLVARINREAARHSVRLDAETYGLLETCLAVGRATGGAFDVGLGGAMAAWGFRAAGGERAPHASADGEPYELDARASTIRFTRPGVALDLGAVGKGFALDLAARELRAAGVECALLHGGTSSSIAIGAPPGESAWRIAIATGAEDDRPVVSLRDASLSVSAPHGRTVERAGERLGHLLDPADGRPLPCEDAPVVAVISPSATLADAWATALTVIAARGEPLPPLPSGLTASVFETTSSLSP